MYKQKYNIWLNSNCIDKETKKELIDIKDEKEIEDRFYRELQFGTGGLRGVLGAGNNRINIYTVGKATQGIADYLLNSGVEEASVSIAYDSRNMSKEFADRVAEILCANGINVNLFESLRPTPVVSYTVRYLKSTLGIVITASHNPKQYNGYKVYGEDGGQITDKLAIDIYSSICAINDFSQVKCMDLKDAESKGLLKIIGEDVDKTYIDKVKALTIRKELVEKHADELKIVYTPIHGSGNIPVRRVLKELGYEHVFIVKEQEMPDGNFPTVSYPNPENRDVFDLALDLAEEVQPDVIFGTDPDCDRIGVVVKDKCGEYKVLTGNQIGALLTHYILYALKEDNKLPVNGSVIKTIVTTDLAKNITEDFDVELIEVLTGFKYIGEMIKDFEKNNKNTYLFGFEESYGYLSGTFVRDKDAVIAATLISEMALWYKVQGKSLYDGLITLYERYGYYKEELISITLEGKEGMKTINKIMSNLRNEVSLRKSEEDKIEVVKLIDYKHGIDKLPKSNVLKFILKDSAWFVVRPSGTEPKIKMYLSVVGDNLIDSEQKCEVLKCKVAKLIDNIIHG